MIPFARTHDGTVSARFTSPEAGLLRDLVEQLIRLLEHRLPAQTHPGSVLLDEQGRPVGSPLVTGVSAAASDDPALARLLPDAYVDDPAASADHRLLTEAGLVERKIASATTVLASLESEKVSLGEVAALAWLRVLSDLRLALAARLGIERDGDEGNDPDLRSVYDWLAWVQESLVEAVDA